MKTLKVHQTKTQLSSILKTIENTGESYAISRNGKLVADLVPHKDVDRLKTDSLLSQVVVHCDLTEPLTEDLWEE